jgi:LuxR family maltose regulon positive regulatory protein
LSGNVLGNPESILLNTYDLCIGDFYACAGQYDRIPRWIRGGEMSMNSLVLPGMVFAYVVYGKARVASGDWVRTEAICETLYRGLDVFRKPVGHIHNYIHLAIATENAGRQAKSRRLACKALEIGQSDDIVMPFAENGVFICCPFPDFLKRRSVRSVLSGTPAQVLHGYADYNKARNPHCGRLSEREIEVLRLMAKGYRQREIADRLFISLITVNKHLQNIYQKLGVDHKTKAINRASELKII